MYEQRSYESFGEVKQEPDISSMNQYECEKYSENSKSAANTGLTEKN